MKRILYFYPKNVLHKNAGTVTRARMLLHYFQSRSFKVDFIHSNDYWGEVMSDVQKAEVIDSGLAERVFDFDRKPPRKKILKYLRYAIPNVFFRKLLKRGASLISNYAGYYPRHLFDEILKQNEYDYIIISYAYWANLVKNNPHTKDARLIIDTHDFLTVQDKDRRRFKLGKAFADEMKRLDLFDEIWAISSDEQYVFDQFCQKPVKLIPICFDQPAQSESTAVYDLIYVASDNPHNLKAADWFFKEVYPHLPNSIRICVIGTIGNHIPDSAGIVKVDYAPELDSYYRQAKIAICPMLSGTGVKVKVLEALSFGLPVIASPRGVDGLINKVDNGCLVADTPAKFSEFIHLLLGSQSTYQFTRQQSVEFFQKNYSKQSLYTILDGIFATKNKMKLNERGASKQY